MKTLFYLSFFMLCFSSINAATASKSDLAKTETVSTEMAQPLEGILALTPEIYKEKTGKKMGFIKRMQLKIAKKIVKKKAKKSSDIPQGLYIVLAIFGLAWLAMGILDGWEGNNWWVNLILTLLFWLPGFIHAMIKMSDYY